MNPNYSFDFLSMNYNKNRGGIVNDPRNEIPKIVLDHINEYENDSRSIDSADVSDNILKEEIKTLKRQNKMIKNRMKRREQYEAFEVIGVKKETIFNPKLPKPLGSTLTSPRLLKSSLASPRQSSDLQNNKIRPLSQASSRAHSPIATPRSITSSLTRADSKSIASLQSRSNAKTKNQKYQLVPSHYYDPDAIHDRLSTVIPSSLRYKRNKVSIKLRKDEFQRRNGFEYDLDELIREYKPQAKSNYKLPSSMEDRMWTLHKYELKKEKQIKKVEDKKNKIENSLWSKSTDHAWLMTTDDITFEKEVRNRVLMVNEKEDPKWKYFQSFQKATSDKADYQRILDEKEIEKEMQLARLKKEQEEFLSNVQEDLQKYTQIGIG